MKYQERPAISISNKFAPSLVLSDKHIPDNQIEDNMSSDVFPTTSKYSNKKQVSQESLPSSVDGLTITISSSLATNITNTQEKQTHENISTEPIINNNQNKDVNFDKDSQSSVQRLNSILSQSNTSENEQQKLNFSSKIDFPTIPKTHTKNKNHDLGKDLNQISSEELNRQY